VVGRGLSEAVAVALGCESLVVSRSSQVAWGWLIGPSEATTFSVCGVYGDGTMGACYGAGPGNYGSGIYPAVHDLTTTQAGSPTAADAIHGLPLL
jgi:hypothetical protein